MISRINDVMASRILPKLQELPENVFSNDFTFWVAGGACIKEDTDLDLFSPDGWKNKYNSKDLLEISVTPNASTYKANGQLVQFCSYTKASLQELLKSFDFAHCQIGCVVKQIAAGIFCIESVEWTQEYTDSRLLGTTWFTSSEYPLSSLLRVNKYVSQGLLPRGSALYSTIAILTRIIERGFKDYKDFKEQLDAVDLGLLPEELAQLEKTDLLKLYELLLKN